MKRPSFQFYPGDWQRNANLRRCSPAARGVWVDVMCLLHDSDEYGVLRWPLKEIAQATGASMSHVKELVDKSVLKGSDKSVSEPFIYTPRSGRKDGDPVTLVAAQAGPIWYSSRMVKDEYVRTIRGESSRFGDESKSTPKAAPKPPIGDGSTSSSSSTPTGKTVPNGTGGKPPVDPELSELWRSLKLALVDQETSKDVAAAGVLLGAASSKYGKDVFLQAARETVKAAPLNAHTYLIGLCEVAAGKRVSLNRQEAIEQQNRAVADAWVPPELRNQPKTEAAA